MKTTLPLIALAGLLLAGCGTITPLQTQQSVYEATAIGLELYPEAAEEVRIAGDVICAQAGKTNINLEEITRDLAAAGVTSKHAKLIVDGALLAYNFAMNLLGIPDKLEKQRPHLLAVCAGIRDALPPPQTMARSRTATAPVTRKPLPPHLK